jgi:hypothetical protein
VKLLLCLVLVGCIQDSYHCEIDSDCNLGEGGRCEANHVCTELSTSCPLTMRSYSAHSDELSGTCFAGQVDNENLCAPGQPPAAATGCAATVCTALPSCCTTEWSEACVIEAQQKCNDVVCDTRLAITATRGAKAAEIFDAQWDGSKWTVVEHPELGTAAAYLAPAPGTTGPRFSAFATFDPVVQLHPSELDVLASTGTQAIVVDPSRDYHDILSLDFDRDLRDTMVLDYADADARTQLVQVLKLDNGDTRDIDTGVSTRMAWGAVADASGFVDGYPDGVAANANTYKTLVNSELNQSKSRTLDTGITSEFDTNNTVGGGGAVRSFTWSDLDGNGSLDLVAFGNAVNVHTAPIDEVPLVQMDCSPPTTTLSCLPIDVSFNGAVLPTAAGQRVLAAPYLGVATQQRVVYEITVNADATITVDTLKLKGSCTTCGVEAVIVRDFDGDHIPDILVIDSEMSFNMALSRTDATLHTFGEPIPFPSIDPPFTLMRVSVTGAPR